MRSQKQIRISNLLRMAELCTPEEAERKSIYMNELDRLMFDDSSMLEVNVTISNPRYEHLVEFYNKYKNLMHNHTPETNYGFYLKYCIDSKIDPLAKLPFCKAMIYHFPFRSVHDHVGAGESRKTINKWLLDGE